MIVINNYKINFKFKYIITFIVFYFTSINLLAQTTDNIKKPKIERITQAFGFLVGQEYSLNYIKSEFPKLGNDVLMAELAFKSTFGKAKDGLNDYLLNYLGEIKFKEYNESFLEEINKRMSNESFSEEIAINFIEDVHNRAKGIVTSPILETLLSFQYIDFPHKELLAGFTTVFKTKGHIKSKNTDWQIRVPKSWRAKEADRPNIIKSFIDDFGDGNQSIMLMVKDIPLSKGYKFSKQEQNEFFTEKEIKIMVPQDAKFISFTKMTIDGNIGGMLEIEQTLSRLDLKLKMRMVEFVFIKDAKIYSLVGTVCSPKTDESLALKMEKYLPLFKFVANSIVLNGQYK